MDLTVPALEYPPMRTGLAQVAGPLDERVVRLDHLEGVGAGVGDGHDAEMMGWRYARDGGRVALGNE